jgi:hypothetical protein
MNWLARLKNEKALGTHATKATKPGFVGFVAPTPRAFQKIEAKEEKTAPLPEAGAGEAAPLSAEEEKTIRRWLSAIGEHDETTIGGVIQQCRSDAAARDYFLERAAEELPKPDPFPDDRRLCTECRHLRGEVCSIAKPGGIVDVARGYRPVRRLVRCVGFEELPAAEMTNGNHAAAQQNQKQKSVQD